MSSNKDGGPAFPRPASEDRFNEENYPPSLGMSLRDYFAAAALKGLLADSKWNPPSHQSGAELCYNWADAMLAERDK